MAPPRLLLLLFFSSFVIAAGLRLQYGAAEPERVSREFFHVEREVAVVIQVSDLHLSAYHLERGEDFVKALSPALRVIRPDLLLITGDLTDAKSKDRLSTRQDESEWIQYRDAVDALVKQSGIDKRRIFDIRGNHDKYGVPFVGDQLDFFSKYSVNSQLNRSNNIYSISLLGNKKTYQFLGIDDTIDVGIRGPSNLFGHPTSQRMKSVEYELNLSNTQPGDLLRKLVFGHFPMSFTASSEKGQRYEDLFARQAVSAYICGHLHATFGRRLWRLHRVDSENQDFMPFKQFWEWEVGDWKDNRLIRLLSIDGGEISFLDVDLSRKHGVLRDQFQTVILVTYPLDSRSMNGVETNSPFLRNDISALVYSVNPILNATAKIFDSRKGFEVVEEINLQLASVSPSHEPLFRAKWNAESYRSASASRYWLQIFVLDSKGKEASSVARPFSVESELAPFSDSLMVYLVFHVRWETLYSVILWGNVCLLILLLCLPKILSYFMEWNASYNNMSVSIASSSRPRKILLQVAWFFVEGSRNTILWLVIVLYFIYLLALPWFWGRATSESGNLGSMYLQGWTIKNPHSLLTRGKLGTPDILTITLPFMYLVVVPMILLIYSLFAENSLASLQSKKIAKFLNRPLLLAEEESVEGVPSKTDTQVSLFYRMCGGWTRRILLLLCLAVALIHLKICYNLMAAYGSRVITISPALTWVPPILIAIAIYSSISIVDEQVTLA